MSLTLSEVALLVAAFSLTAYLLGYLAARKQDKIVAIDAKIEAYTECEKLTREHYYVGSSIYPSKPIADAILVKINSLKRLRASVFQPYEG